MPEVEPASPVPPSSTKSQCNALPFHPLFTVVTVTFNAEKTLERTLHSVADQTYDNIVHLIVDGLSSDGTLSLIQEYAEDNSVCAHQHEIRFIREPDNGLYDAMNKAIENAEGDYILFLNAGDCFHSPDIIEKVARQLTDIYGCSPDPEQLPAVLYGETDLVDGEGHFLRHRRLKAPEQLTWRSFLNGMLVCHQSFYVRQDLARKHLYDMRYRFSADFDWCIRIMQEAESLGLTMRNTELILTDYLSEGMTTRNRRKSLMERMRIMCRHYGILHTLYRHFLFVLRLVTVK